MAFDRQTPICQSVGQGFSSPTMKRPCAQHWVSSWGILSGNLSQAAMLTSHQQIVLECLQARRFLEQSGCLTIDNTIAIVHADTLYLYARKPWVVDWVLANLEAVKNDAYIICGAKTIGLFCYGESIDEFCTRDILVGNADVTFATSPTMTIATPEPVVQFAPVSAPAALETTIETPVARLFTIDELSEIAHQAGRFDLAEIKAEILALNPKAFVYGEIKLYALDAAEQAIRNLSSDVIQRTRTIASQWSTSNAEAKVTAAKTAAKKKTSARKPAAKKTVATT